MKHFLALLLWVLPLGSCGSCVMGHLGNIEGDGIEPAQTLTASILGLDRGNRCEYDEYDHYWYCLGGYFSAAEVVARGDDFYDRKEAEIQKSRPIAVFVAKWMLMPFEWVLAFIAILISSSLFERWEREKRERSQTAE